MSTRLFDGGSDESDNDLSLGTNKDYAKSYNKFRQKELLKKFKDRGQAVSESDSSSDSESSEDEEVLDPKFDQEFFKTLASLKSKDPVIYDKSKKFFDGVGKFNADDDDDEDDADADGSAINKSTQKEKKMKPVTLKDYERKVMLEKGGKYEDDSEYEDNEEPLRSASPTLVEEERRLKAEFRNVMNANEESDDEEAGFGGIFKKREKSKQETAREEEDFAKWLAGKKEDIQEEDKQRLEPLKNYWSSSKLPQSERFLRDYILNKGYANTNFSDIPTYDEIVGDNAPLSEDEEELEKQAEFEHKYNFRFEEPDAEFITRYPRTIENSVRRTDDKRKQKRVETKERKQHEKQQQMRELEIVREMKRKEIADKIEKLKLVTGNDEVGFKDDELEEDFDPEAHDRRMQEIFDDDYYQVNEGEEKPECPSDIDELKIEDWDNYDPHKSYGNDDDDDYAEHCEDDDFNMDCDYDPAAAKEQLQQELIENTRGRKGRKGRRNRFMEMIQSEKPAFDPEDERTYAEYIDEYYKMDCEDIIGDVPCRFKYVETTPNDFGLSIEEILLAKNKELNQWASLKKAIQIRPDFVEKKEQRLYKMKSKNEDLKRKIFKSLYGDGSDEEPEENEIPNIAGNSAEQKTTESTNLAGETVATVTVSKKKRKRKAQAAQAQSNTAEGSAQQLDAKPEIENDDVTAAKKPKEELENTDESATISKTNVEQVAAATGETVAAKKKRNKKKKKKPAANQKEVADKTTTPDTTQPKSVPQTKPTNAGTNPFGGGGGGNNKKTFNGKVGGGNTTKSAPTLPKKPFNGAVGKNPFGSAGAKNNNKPAKAGNDSKAAPTIRKNAVGAAGKFKNKFKNKDADSKISDERLKAYGINPRKFHKQQKYGGKKED